jgi:hypothetical protein
LTIVGSSEGSKIKVTRYFRTTSCPEKDPVGGRRKGRVMGKVSVSGSLDVAPFF